MLARGVYIWTIVGMTEIGGSLKTGLRDMNKRQRYWVH